MKKMIIFGIVFLMMTVSVNAVINTTFGGNSNPSLKVSDYILCAGYFPSNPSILCNPFSNSTTFTSVLNLGSVSASEQEVNITPLLLETHFRSVNEIPQKGVACDFIYYEPNTNGKIFQLGFDDESAYSGADNNILQFGNTNTNAVGLHYGSNLWSGFNYMNTIGIFNNFTLVSNITDDGEFSINNTDKREGGNGGARKIGRAHV